MKILIVDFFKGFGGAQVHLYNLIDELKKNNIQVDLLCRSHSINENKFVNKVNNIYPIHRTGIKAIFSILKIRKLLIKNNYDIIHLHRDHDLLQFFLSYFLSFPLNKKPKIVLTFHIPNYKKNFLYKFIDNIICISNYVKESVLKKNKYLKSKIKVLHYGIEIIKREVNIENKFNRRERKYFNKYKGYPLIAMIGAFWKNQEELIKLTKEIIKFYPEINVLFIGDTSDEINFLPKKELVKKLNLEKNIFFTGLIPREKLLYAYEELDLAVSTHRNEGFGLVHIECLSAGVPIVCYNSGGITDIFDLADVGCKVNTKQEFIKAIKYLIENKEARLEKIKNGLNIVKNYFTKKAQGKRYIDFYNSILDK